MFVIDRKLTSNQLKTVAYTFEFFRRWPFQSGKYPGAQRASCLIDLDHIQSLPGS